jgi:hypothetical protein
MRNLAGLLGCIVLLATASGLLAQDAPSSTVETTPTVMLVAPAPTSGTPVYTPLSRHERWHGYLHETFLGTKPAAQIFGTALLDHIGHAPTQWGVGLHGYTHRLENRFFATMIDGSVHSSLAAILHQDTRYLRAHDGRFTHRAAHALKRTLFTYDSAGGRVLDISGLGGIYAGTMIPELWHPNGYSPFHQGVQAGNFGVMFQAANNLIQEFRPDLEHLFVKKK